MSDAPWPVEGDPAPDFSLPDADGRVHSLADYSGKWLVLYFYPKDSTSGCTTEALEFSGLLPRFLALGAQVVGVSRDKPGSHRKFIDKHELTVTLLSDPELATLAAYGAWREKKVCGKDCLGTVRSTFLIDPKGVVRGAWPQVAKALGHAETVLAALTRLAGS
ncbi:MAG: peroxiredoxin [Acidobacteriota bacterium]